MTEQEWLKATDPTPMLEFLRDKASDRKLRLFACACCRRFWHVITSIDSSRTAVEIAEQLADGQVENAVRRETVTRLNYVNTTELLRWIENAAGLTLNVQAFRAAEGALTATRHFGVFGIPKAINGVMNPIWVQAYQQEGEWQVTLLHDIFYTNFRPATIDPRWLTESVVSLAQYIYSERAFDRMPSLADALEDAGCDNADILNHCRGEGPHVRGCWVVDLLLGKQ